GLAASFAAVTFAVYGVGYFLLHPNGLRIEPPALANVLFLLILLGWILPCLSFFLDRFRVPLVVFLASLTFLLYFISDIDHYYLLNELGKPHAIIAEKQVDANVGKEVESFLFERQRTWARHHPDRKPVLVAVAASGGGITASLWTAKVLAELQRELGPEFSESIYGLSTVSGGSVGSMYFIDAFEGGRAPTQKSLDQVIDNAGTSSLAATAWGLAYPDFWRGFSLQNPFRPFFDRAWAMEQVWRRTMRPGGTKVPTLETWRADVRSGRRPAALFNATIAETGERLVLSPLKLNPLPGGCVADDSGFDDCVDARTFTQLYEDKDLPVTTAARLSATFPFVSPITRPRLADSDEVSNPYHVADGGYYDNYGVVSLVEGLRRVINIYDKKSRPETIPQPSAPEPADAGAPMPRPKILVVEIRASDSREAKEAKRRAGWAFGTAGPVMTLLNVWGSGQTPRNDLDLQLLKEVAERRGFEIETVLFPLVSDAPLSWHLTESQKQDIERGWDWCAAMPEREGQKSKVQLGLGKVRAFLTKSAGWKGLPQTRFSTPPSGVSPEDMQALCLGVKRL
ncbi:MAG TPA: patatin-like phospholipase family protein, partial [Gemmatimonadales bacterium]|nr:patatin-like phospholipase family protein [Gemmatimonadales bacterium]